MGAVTAMRPTPNSIPSLLGTMDEANPFRHSTLSSVFPPARCQGCWHLDATRFFTTLAFSLIHGCPDDRKQHSAVELWDEDQNEEEHESAMLILGKLLIESCMKLSSPTTNQCRDLGSFVMMSSSGF